MGCSQSSVVPLAESDIDERCGIKVRVNPSTPEQVNGKFHKEGLISTEKTKDGHWTLNGKVKRDKKAVSADNIKTKSKKKSKSAPPPIAFEVPFNEENGDGNLVKKHPPKRLRRLEEQPTGTADLTHDVLEERQREAEQRRREILSQRVMSAKERVPRRIIHSDGASEKSEGS